MDKRVIKQIFCLKPDQWGLRGDPFLWNEIEETFLDKADTISSIEFKDELLIIYHGIIEARKTDVVDDMIHMKGFPQEGMSGGVISISWWQEKGLRKLSDNFSRVTETDRRE